MANRFYDSPELYDDAVDTYDGSVQVYNYSGNIPIVFIQSYSVQNIFGGHNYYYTGRVNVNVLMHSVYRRGFMRTPRIGGMFARVVPNSSIVIRQYQKSVQDSIVKAGCPQCGTLMYNK